MAQILSVFRMFSSLVVVVTISHLTGIAGAQDLREQARQQAIRNPGVPLMLPAPPWDYPPKPIEELTREADVVLQARLSRRNSYLSPNGDRVLTDYSILGASVIAGHLPVASTRMPGPVPPLILTVLGGEVVVDGVSIRGTNQNRGAIENGGRYLLFLKRAHSGELGRYDIYYGGIFEISQDQVEPLLKRADHVFKDTVDSQLSDFISRIQKAVRPQ